MTEPAAPTAGEVADMFGRTAKLMARRFDDALDAAGTSYPRARVLAEIVRHEPIRITDIALAVGISQGTASSLVDALVRDDLAARSRDPADGRATRMASTAQGKRQAAHWLQAYTATAEELFAALPRDRWPELIEMMAILSNQGR